MAANLFSIKSIRASVFYRDRNNMLVIMCGFVNSILQNHKLVLTLLGSVSSQCFERCNPLGTHCNLLTWKARQREGSYH